MFKKLVCAGLIGFILPTMGGCPCCGTAGCCEQGDRISETGIQNWLDQADEQQSSAESTNSLTYTRLRLPHVIFARRINSTSTCA